MSNIKCQGVRVGVNVIYSQNSETKFDLLYL